MSVFLTSKDILHYADIIRPSYHRACFCKRAEITSSASTRTLGAPRASGSPWCPHGLPWVPMWGGEWFSHSCLHTWVSMDARWSPLGPRGLPVGSHGSPCPWVLWFPVKVSTWRRCTRRQRGSVHTVATVSAAVALCGRLDSTAACR